MTMYSGDEFYDDDVTSGPLDRLSPPWEVAFCEDLDDEDLERELIANPHLSDNDIEAIRALEAEEL